MSKFRAYVSIGEVDTLEQAVEILYACEQEGMSTTIKEVKERKGNE